MATSNSVPAGLHQKIILQSSIDPGFTMEVDSRVINSSSVLKDILANTTNDAPAPVAMNKDHLQKFVEFHNHFESPETPKDVEWTNAFFGQMSDTEFKDFVNKVDYIDSQRLLEASGDFVLSKLREMDIPQIQKYLSIIDDYTEEERRAMQDHPLEFFSGVVNQGGNGAGDADADGNVGNAQVNGGNAAAIEGNDGNAVVNPGNEAVDNAEVNPDNEVAGNAEPGIAEENAGLVG